MLLPNIRNQHSKGDAKALMGVWMWDAQRWGIWDAQGRREEERKREGIGASKGAWGLLVWMLKDLSGGLFK